MYEFYVIFKRDLINIIKNPTLLMYNTLFPFLLILILGFLSSGNYGKGEISSYDYYGVTMLILCLLNVSLTASNTFMEKSLKISNLRIMYSPIKTSYIYLSKIFSTFFFTVICFLLLMLVSNLFLNVNFGGKNSMYIIVFVLLFDLLSSTLGVLFCCIFKSEEAANKILSVFVNIFAVLGGLFFQLDGFGAGVEKITYISPVKWVAKGSFKIIYDNDLSYFVPISISLIILSILMMLGCKLFFRTEDYV
jgi:ABC-2 type transport system permease protein